MSNQSTGTCVVFDFDHTLYNGDSGTHFVGWLLKRNILRTLLAVVCTPVLGLMVAWLPLRRLGISGYLWIATVGTSNPEQFNVWITEYTAQFAAVIQSRLLPVALKVLEKHRAAGDLVIIATGAPPLLARHILAMAEHGDLPVLGTLVKPFLGGLVIQQHCHYEQKMRMLNAEGYSPIQWAYSDSSADLPLLKAALQPVVVNPKRQRVEMFQQVLPAGTPILNWGCPDRGGEIPS